MGRWGGREAVGRVRSGSEVFPGRERAGGVNAGGEGGVLERGMLEGTTLKGEGAWGGMLAGVSAKLSGLLKLDGMKQKRRLSINFLYIVVKRRGRWGIDLPLPPFRPLHFLPNMNTAPESKPPPLPPSLRSLPLPLSSI